MTEARRPIPQPSIVRGVVFPPRPDIPSLYEAQAEWDAERAQAAQRGEHPATSLVLWCSIIAAGLMLAVAFGLCR